MAIGILVFYGSFFAFTFYLEDIKDVPFLVHYIVMPFMVLIALHLFSEIAFIPFNLHDNWLLKYYSDYFDNQKEEHKTKNKLKTSAIIILFIKIFCFALFFITLFFMRK